VKVGQEVAVMWVTIALLEGEGREHNLILPYTSYNPYFSQQTRQSSLRIAQSLENGQVK
jgi:hypothetical protein